MPCWNLCLKRHNTFIRVTQNVGWSPATSSRTCNTVAMPGVSCESLRNYFVSFACVLAVVTSVCVQNNELSSQINTTQYSLRLLFWAIPGPGTNLHSGKFAVFCSEGVFVANLVVTSGRASRPNLTYKGWVRTPRYEPIWQAACFLTARQTGPKYVFSA